jgi:glycerol-3-phosphate dehydrogenase
MTRDLPLLAQRQFDLLVVGGGIHGLAAAYDAAQRGLTVALVESGDFGSGASFHHLKTVHGGLRYLQNADLKRMRESIVERRTLALIAPHLLTPLPFLMPTYRKFTRSRLAMRVAFAADAVIGSDRNEGVVARLRLPMGRTMSRADCLALFPGVKQAGLTGGALWHDYQVRSTERLTLAFALAAARAGACLANYATATGALTSGGRVTGMRVRDELSGDEFDVRATITLNAAGFGAGRIMEAFGVAHPYPLLKATNLVTTRAMTGPALSSSTDSGRMLFIVPWQGRAMAGTFNSADVRPPEDLGVTDRELDSFLAETNQAFPDLRLRHDDVTLVHRGLMVAARNRSGELEPEGHFRIREHANDGVDGAVSLIGVKFTTGRGVAEQAIDVVMRRLDRSAECRTAKTPLPGGETDLDEVLRTLRHGAPQGLDDDVLGQLAETYGSEADELTAMAATERSLAQRVARGVPVIRAQVLHAIRGEMATTLTDVVARRTPLGVAGHPGREAVEGCAAVMAQEMVWSQERVEREMAALAAFYLPAGEASSAPRPGA